MPAIFAPPPKTKLGHHRLLCPNASILVSPLCLGAMGFGEIWSSLLGECNKDTSYAILDHFHAAGGNFIDTANYYMAGQSEEWLGDWIADRGVRDQVVLATKFMLPFKLPEQMPEGSVTSNFGGANRKSLRLSLLESLKRLKTDYVDILYVHAWDGVTSIPELMRSLDDVVKQGKVLYLGISNWPAWMVVKANDYARQHCLTPFVVYQGLWNVVARDIERDIVPMCKAEGMAITVWEAMGAGKFKSKTEKAEKGGRPPYDISGKGMEAYERAADALERVGKRKGTNGVGIALRYITLKAPYVFPIIGGRKIEQYQANIDNLSIQLSEEDLREIEEAAPMDLGYPHAFMSGKKDKHVGPTNPTKLEMWWGGFEGVEEPKPEILSTSENHYSSSYAMSQVFEIPKPSKRMRDTQRTCAECRRRKIRCTFGPDSADECVRCLARGIACVAPKQRGVHDPDDERRTLRERVSQLESLVESLLQQNNDNVEKPATVVTADDEVEAGGFDDDLSEIARSAPLVAALEASQLLSTQSTLSTKVDQRHGQSDQHDDRETPHFLSFKPAHENASHICDQLRSALPPYEQLREFFSGGTRWWDAWHLKTFGANVASESLLQFLDRVYWTGTAIELGFVVSALGRHNVAEASHYLPLVDSLILANDRFAGTLEGLVLSVFHAKVYLDMGQPHRAFLCNRRGISLAQNLHRNYARSTKRSVIWWTMYLGDRLSSVLLGLPYSISDHHFTVTFTDDPSRVGHASRAFAIHLGMLMGRVIDQVQNRKGPKLSEVLDIDDELESLASTKAGAWWKFSVPPVADPSVINDLRERLICQVQYFLTKVYLHLPYLLKAPSSHLYKGSRVTAIDSARGVVSRYHALRSYVDGEPIYDCQSLDFVGFMGAVVMVMGTFRGSEAPALDDIELINKTVQILQQLAANNANQLAHQCRSTLSILLSLCQPDKRHDSAAPSKIRIPYFGTLYVASERDSRNVLTASGQQATLSDDLIKDGSTRITHDSNSNEFLAGEIPTIAYQGLYDMDWTQDELCGMPESLDFMANLDQDWESFLNSGLQ